MVIVGVLGSVRPILVASRGVVVVARRSVSAIDNTVGCRVSAMPTRPNQPEALGGKLSPHNGSPAQHAPTADFRSYGWSPSMARLEGDRWFKGSMAETNIPQDYDYTKSTASNYQVQGRLVRFLCCFVQCRIVVRKRG
jgi:hypothetical protein